jgi:hypothetical protein
MTYNAADHVSCLQEIDRLNGELHKAREAAQGQQQAADYFEAECSRMEEIATEALGGAVECPKPIRIVQELAEKCARLTAERDGLAEASRVLLARLVVLGKQQAGDRIDLAAKDLNALVAALAGPSGSG